MADTHATYRVPKVYFYDYDHRLLIMEWLNGISLQKQLWHSSLNRTCRISSIHKSGEWLRAFHEVSTLSNESVDFTCYLTVIKQRIALQSTNHLPNTPDSTLFVRAYQILNRQISTSKPIAVPHAIVHGDFTPANVVLERDHVIGIDIWALERKPILIDLARMAVYLTVAYPPLRGENIYDAAERMHQSVKALTDGYGTDLAQPETQHFKLALLSEYLRRWLVIDKRPLTAKNFITKPYLISRIKQQIRSLLPLIEH